MIPAPRYRMPAEWEPHRGVWMSWPHREASWPDRFEPVPDAYARLVAAIAPFTPVHLNVGEGDTLKRQAERLLGALGVAMERIQFHAIPTDDAWCRDHGPIFVEDSDGGTVLLDWEFNAWGGKYEPHDQDNAVPARIARVTGLPIVRPGLVLEGGSIDVNGNGALLTTESCLLNPNRNPGVARADVEAHLCRYLGARTVLWLGQGIEGDDTDGHIDDLARFVDPHTIVACVENDPASANHDILADNLARLRAAVDARGRPFHVAPLTMPDGVTVDGEPVPASYANFFITNGAVLVPTFRHRKDAEALETLSACFPRHRVIGVDCTDLIWGLGAIHCLTQQWPAAQERRTP